MPSYSRAITAAPENIVDDGRCNMGTFNSPIRNINLSQISRPLGRWAPAWLNQFRLKEWQAFQVDNPDWFICFAVYDTKSLGTAIIMAFNKQQQKMYRYEHKVPTWRLQVPSGLHDSNCCYHSSTLNIDIHNQLSQGLFTITLSTRGFKGLPDLVCKFQAYHRTEPIVIVQPFDENRPLYSHKALMPAAGTICFEGDEKHYDENHECMILDDHKGFYPYVMQYDWVTGLGHDSQQQLQGFNLTDNQIQDPEHYNENCLWTEGKMHPLPPVQITRPNGVSATWEIRDKYQQVSLRFTPIADVPNRLNIGVAKVDYHGPTGMFDGYILDKTGKKIHFDALFGMGEKKYIRM